MKNSNILPAVIILIIIVSSLLLWNYMKTNQPKYDWNEVYYDSEREQPYGLKILYRLLKTEKDGEIKNQNTGFHTYLKGIVEEDGVLADRMNYVFIGIKPYYSKEDIETLIKFVKSGNTVIISAYKIPSNLLAAFANVTYNSEIENPIDKAYFEEIDKKPESEVDISDFFGYDNSDDSGIDTFEISDGNLSVTYHPYEDIPKKAMQTPGIRFSTIANEWEPSESFYFYLKEIKDTLKFNYLELFLKEYCSYYNFNPLLKNTTTEGLVMMEKTINEGKIIFHTLPLAFTNYHLLRNDGRKHAEFVFSNLNIGPIIWDEFSQQFLFETSQSKYSSETSLSYILSKRSLSWAFYILLGTCLIFVVLHSKRKQAPVPVLAPKTNTSLEFVKMVGQLYFNNRNNREIINRMLQQFHTDNYFRYRIQDHNPETLIPKLSGKSGVDAVSIKKILDLYQYVQQMDSDPDDHMLQAVFEAIHYFNQNRK
jgi:hypothetical protein